MRVGIDLFALVPGTGRGGGFARYTTGLVNGLQRIGGDDQFVLFTNPLNRSMFPDGGPFSQVVVPLPPQRALWPFRLAWQHAALPIIARTRALDLMHFPMDTASAFSVVPFVVTTNDLIADHYYPTHYPAAISPAKVRYLRSAKRRSAQRARLVICPSAATASEVERHYSVPREQLVVVPDGVEFEQFQHTGELTAPETPYVLTVLSLSPHKNVGGAIGAFALARKRYGLPHELRLIGMPGTDASPVKQAIDQAVHDGVPVKYLGYVTDAELARQYRQADLFLFLSLVEGFGLPPLEAMAAGIPVIASNVSSIPEVVGDAGRLVSPTNVDHAATAIGELLSDPVAARRLAERGRSRARQFSWDRTALATRDVYERAVRHLKRSTRTSR